ncbi:hypothetical protein T484DRAFT_1915429, partial [Baffinella frigidus]
MCREREDEQSANTCMPQESAGRRAVDGDGDWDGRFPGPRMGGMRGAARVALGLLACAAPASAFTGGALAGVSFTARSHAGVCSRQLVSAPLLGGSIALHCSAGEGATPRGSNRREARGAARAQSDVRGGRTLGKEEVVLGKEEVVGGDGAEADKDVAPTTTGQVRALGKGATLTISRKAAEAWIGGPVKKVASPVEPRAPVKQAGGGRPGPAG